MDLEPIRRALENDRTIDIVTTGARTGRPRRIEIWFTNLGGRIIICGTPSARGPKGRPKPRDWLANLSADPALDFCLKESVQVTLPARAREITDPDDRRRVMSAPETRWYRQQGYSVDELAAHGPIVEVVFTGEYAALNAGSSAPAR